MSSATRSGSAAARVRRTQASRLPHPVFLVRVGPFGGGGADVVLAGHDVQMVLVRHRHEDSPPHPVGGVAVVVLLDDLRQGQRHGDGLVEVGHLPLPDVGPVAGAGALSIHRWPNGSRTTATRP